MIPKEKNSKFYQSDFKLKKISDQEALNQDLTSYQIYRYPN